MRHLQLFRIFSTRICITVLKILVFRPPWDTLLKSSSTTSLLSSGKYGKLEIASSLQQEGAKATISLPPFLIGVVLKPDFHHYFTMVTYLRHIIGQKWVNPNWPKLPVPQPLKIHIIIHFCFPVTLITHTHDESDFSLSLSRFFLFSLDSKSTKISSIYSIYRN